jgi:hypothetical protein
MVANHIYYIVVSTFIHLDVRPDQVGGYAGDGDSRAGRSTYLPGA